MNEGERLVQIEKLNRNKIPKDLLECPSTFTGLKKKVQLSGQDLDRPAQRSFKKKN